MKKIDWIIDGVLVFIIVLLCIRITGLDKNVPKIYEAETNRRAKNVYAVPLADVNDAVLVNKAYIVKFDFKNGYRAKSNPIVFTENKELDGKTVGNITVVYMEKK